jgi:hypothetical protein
MEHQDVIAIFPLLWIRHHTEYLCAFCSTFFFFKITPQGYPITFNTNVDRSPKSKDTDYKNNKKEFEDTKGVIRIRKSKKYRQRNGQKKKDKRTNNDLKKMHIKLKIE